MSRDNNTWIWVLVIVLIIVFLFGGFGFGMMGNWFGNYRDYGRMGSYWTGGFGFMWIFMMLFMLLIVVLVVLGIIWLVRQLQQPVRRRR